MIQRIVRNAASVAAVALLVAGGTAEAGYRYGGYGGAGEDQGFFLFLDVGSANPRNSDSVAATAQTLQNFGGGVNSLNQLRPEWDDEVAGRLGVGYRWSDGNKLEVAFWSFESDTSIVADGPAGGLLYFAVGPPILTGSDVVGDSGSPGFVDMQTEITAETFDVTWGRTEALGDVVSLDWDLGLRYASFEETWAGVYDEASRVDPDFARVRYTAAKSNEGEMFGIRAALTGRYRINPKFSFAARLGFSLLDGELTASSSLRPTGQDNSATVPASSSTVEDDGRSGSIREVDVRATWHLAGDAVRVSLGWEQSVWDEIAADVVRNFPGTVAPLAARDSVSFSGYKIGLYLKF